MKGFLESFSGLLKRKVMMQLRGLLTWRVDNSIKLEDPVSCENALLLPATMHASASFSIDHLNYRDYTANN